MSSREENKAASAQE